MSDRPTLWEINHVNQASQFRKWLAGIMLVVRHPIRTPIKITQSSIDMARIMVRVEMERNERRQSSQTVSDK